MRAEATARPRAHGFAEAAAPWLFAALSLQYAWQATVLAARAPWWMDEVLARWTAQARDLPALWAALVRGAEFNPPLYDGLLHFLIGWGATGPLALRLPSVVAGYLAALATGAVARRHAGPVAGFVAAGAVLSSGLFAYAVQARPYALVTAALAGAVALHDRTGGRASSRRAAAIGVLLVLALGASVYALVPVGVIAGAELVRARLESRPIDRRMLAAAALALASILLWWPIITAARIASAADIAAPGYYARPTVPALVLSYGGLMGWLLLPLAGLLALLLCAPRLPANRALTATAFVLVALPAGVWLFARLGSGSFSDRYGLAGTVGLGLLFAALLARLGARAAPVGTALLALFVAGGAWRAPGELGKTDRLDAIAAVSAAPGPLPIVTGSGLRFLELMVDAAPAARRRLVFADVPGSPSDSDADPTNRHQVERWHAIRPALPVVDARRLCGRPFLLFAQAEGGGSDLLPGWMAVRTRLRLPRGASLTPVRALACQEDHR